MKQLFFILSLVSLVGYGCNRDNKMEGGTGTGIDAQEQERENTVIDPGTGASDARLDTGSEGDAAIEGTGTETESDDETERQEFETQQYE